MVHRRLIMPIFRRVTTEECLKFLSESSAAGDRLYNVGTKAALDAEQPVRILIIEDETKVANALRAGLEAEHYEVTIATTGEEGFFLANQASFDLLLLDLMLPRRDGIDVLATLRKRGIQTPIFVLTAKDAVEDRVIGLDQGADDYLTKPFAFSELLARIRALLRRGRMDQILKLQHEDLEMDLVTHKVSRGAQSLDLTAKEFEILEYLLRHSGTSCRGRCSRAMCGTRRHGPRRSTMSSTSRSRACVARSTNRTKESCCTRSAASDTCWAEGQG